MVKRMICVASLVLAMQSPAFAQQKLPDVAVAYGDLDLTKSADLRTFDRRLSWAIQSACPDGRGVGGDEAARNCRLAKRAEIATYRTQALAAAKTRTSVAAVGSK